MTSSIQACSSVKLPLILLILSLLSNFALGNTCGTWFETLGTGNAQCVPVRFARMWHTGGTNADSYQKHLNVYSEAMCYATCQNAAFNGMAFQSFTWSRGYNECYCTLTLASFNPILRYPGNQDYLYAVTNFAGTCAYYSQCRLRGVPCEDVHVCDGKIVLLNGAAPRTIDSK